MGGCRRVGRNERLRLTASTVWHCAQRWTNSLAPLSADMVWCWERSFRSGQEELELQRSGVGTKGGE